MNENRLPQVGTEQKLDVRVKVYPVKEENSKLLAFASVTLNGCFAKRAHLWRCPAGKIRTEATTTSAVPRQRKCARR